MGRPSAGPRRRGQPAETAPQPEPRRSSPPVAFAAVLPAGNSRRGPAAAECPRAARAEAHVRLGRGRSDRNVSSRSARRCSAGASAPKRSLPHSAIGWSGVFCRSCEALHSTQVCGVSASRAWNSSMRRDLPRPGSPTTSTSWPSPCERAPSGAPAGRVPPRGRRTASAPARRPFGRRRSRERCERAATGVRHALEFCARLVLDDEKPGDLPLHVQR